MPESLNQTTASDSSFIGLQSYAEANANSFFGRDSEIENLSRLVKLNTLTILFGKSGTGKTSLLNAGVFPNLRKNYCLPFRIRLEFNDTSADLITQIKTVLKQEIDNYGFKVQSYPGSETLWEYFHKEPLWKSITPILVFDQFEEIFTLAKNNPRFTLTDLPAFWEELSDIIENTIPEKLKTGFLNKKENILYNYRKQKTKIVFAFREEYLPEFEGITTKIPSIKTSRFRLLPMNGHQAYEVITKTWKENIKPAEAKQIISYLTNQSNPDYYELITIEPSLLSQVCAFIDKGRIDAGLTTVSTELLHKFPPHKILSSIYNEAIADGTKAIPNYQEEKDSYNPLKEFLEEKMITADGFRTKYSLTGKDEHLQPGIEVLIDKYLLRQELNAVELTHDVLTPLLKKDREKRRKETAIASGKKKALKRFLIILLSAILIGFSLLAYSFIKRHSIQGDIDIAKIEKDSVENLIEVFHEKLKNDKKSLEDEFFIRHRVAQLKDSIKLLKGKLLSNTNIGPIDSALYESLRNRITDLQNDSVSLANTIDQIRKKIISTESEKQLLQKELTDSKRRIDFLQGENRNLNKEISGLNASAETLRNSLIKANEQIRVLNAEIDYLKQTIKKQGETINDLINKKTSPPYQGNLRISIFDSTSQKILFNENLDVYIIPLNKQNKKLLDQAENNTIMQMKDCTAEFQDLLNNFSGYQKAFFSNGYYYFPQVIRNGDYKIKICNIFSGYYDLKMPVNDKKILWKRKNAPTVEIQPGKF